MVAADEQRLETGRRRRHVFANLANGVPVEQIATAMRLSVLEIEQARAFVARKLTEHLVLRRQAPIACDNVGEVRWNRRPLLAVLARIGDLDLSTDLILKRVTVQAIDHPEMIQGAQARMSEAYA